MHTIFVYGALMRGGPGQVNPRAASVADHAVRFIVAGLAVLEPAFAALVEEPGEVAHGVLFEVDDETLEALKRRESGYTMQTVTAVDRDGLSEPALAFFIPPQHSLSREGQPSRRYANLLVEGAIQEGLPEVVVERYREFARKGPQITTALLVFRPLVRLLTPVLGLLGAVAVTGSLIVLAVWLLLWWAL